MQNQSNSFDTSTTSCFLEIHMSEDDEILLLCLRDTLRNEVVKSHYVFEITLDIENIKNILTKE